MNKFTTKIFAFLLGIALLCGCAANNTNSEAPNSGSVVTEPGEETSPSVPEENGDEEKELPIAELTDEELAEWTAYFNEMEHNGLLRFPCANPAADPDALAPYLGWMCYDIGDHESEFSGDELKQLEKAGLWLELDAFRLTRDFLNNYLYEHFNILAGRTENLLDAADLGIYLLLYDAWYIAHGDTGYHPYAMERGEVYENGTVRLWYFNDFLAVAQENGELDYIDAEMVLTLAPREDGSYYIVSHEINSSTYQN